jgi:hypothetical protein
MPMNEKSFVAFILTHGRPDRVHTFNSLRRAGYTGRVVIVLDNEDKTRAEYEKEFCGTEIEVFDKKAISDTFDEGDNFQDRRAIIYARNACFEIAKKLGVRYFIELDDDYQCMQYRFDAKGVYRPKNILSIDKVFDAMVGFLKTSKCSTVAMAQGGDYIGGDVGSFAKKLRLHRKAMNTFVCDAQNPFQFFGRINEDVNLYTCGGRRGILLFTIPNVSIVQKQTQSNAGGMSDLYLDSGTYVKSFYSVMYAPSCVKIKDMGPVHRRLHHSVKWKNAVPCIVGEELRKPDVE